MDQLHRGLERNVWLYGYYKIFVMRAFLPLIAVYLSEVGGVSLAQIGILTTVGALVSLIAQIPTGYFADRVSRRSAILTGAVCIAFATSALVAGASFAHGMTATLLMAVGYAFVTGAGPALMHDSLEQLGRLNDYVKVMGRAQSKALIGNVVLVGLVPMTYGIDKRLPFVLGLVMCGGILGLGMLLTEPHRQSGAKPQGSPLASLTASLRTFVTRHTVMFFVSLGLLSGLYVSASNVNNLVFVDLGINPSFIGLMYAGASIVGAIGGYVVHYLLKLPFRAYLLIDATVCGLFFASVGLTRNMWVAVVGFVLMLGFWRLRMIMYEDNLLRRLHASGSKATLVSTLHFFQNLSQIWQPLAIVAVVGGLGYYQGYVMIGLTAGVVFSALLVGALHVMEKGHTATKPVPVADSVI